MLSDFADLHSTIANQVWPAGALLTCQRCGHVIEASAEQCADYLAHGWPKHCGQTMVLSRKGGAA